MTTKTTVKIAAIDNGLAFPFKHPDRWRTYPFEWTRLPQARLPFSSQIKDLILPRLSNADFVENQLCRPIRRLFAQDPRYNRRIVEGQLSVMRGQVTNEKTFRFRIFLNWSILFLF